MPQITKQITLDVTKPNMLRFVTSKQNDSASRFIRVTLTDDGEVLPVTENSEIVVSAERPGGQKAAFRGTVNADGSLTIPITGWMSESEGCVRCDVSVYEDGTKLTAMTFIIENEGAIMTSGEIEEDENFGALSSLLSELRGIETSENTRVASEGLRTAAETARINSENLRSSAESARVSAETSRVTAESARVSAETSRSGAESSRSSAEAVRVSSESARVSSENNRRSAENSRSSAETGRASAESSRATAESARISAENARVTAENLRVAAEAQRTTFVPSISAAGVLSWTNDKGLTNPAPVQIVGQTPVRGTDYWTTADVNAIRAYIDSVLLGGEW